MKLDTQRGNHTLGSGNGAQSLSDKGRIVTSFKFPHLWPLKLPRQDGRIMARLQRALGDRKIDVLLIDPTVPLEPLHRVAQQEGRRGRPTSASGSSRRRSFT